METTFPAILFWCFIVAASSAQIPETVEIQPISALAGERVTLSCHIDYSGTENMNAHMALWRKLETAHVRSNSNQTEETPVGLGERVTVVNDHKHVGKFQLIINNVSVDDSGIYQCYILRLPNLDISVLSAVNLRVLVPPTDGYPKCRLLSSVTPPLSMGDLFTLKCVSKGGTPPSRVRWYLRGEPISDIGENIVASPRIFNAKDFNATYTCREENEALAEVRECSVTPRETNFQVKISKESENGNNRLKCQIYGKTSEEASRFDWFLNGMKVGVTVTKSISDVIEINSRTEKVALICCTVTLPEESVTNCTKLRSHRKSKSNEDSHVNLDSDFSEYFDYTEMADDTKTVDDIASSRFAVVMAILVAALVGTTFGVAIVTVFLICMTRKNDGPISINIGRKETQKSQNSESTRKNFSIRSEQSQTTGGHVSFKRRPLRARPISRAWTFDTRCLTINSIFDDLSLLHNDNVTSVSSNEGNTTEDTVVNTSSECYLPLRPESISSSKYEGLGSHTVVGQDQSYEVPLSAEESLNYEDIQNQGSDSWESEPEEYGVDDVSSNDLTQREPFYHNDSMRKSTSGSGNRCHNSIIAKSASDECHTSFVDP